jgi:DeoR/GlpR family transcriptional regulator of sugar metabolism
MLKDERQAYIIKQINIHNKVLSADLSRQLDVSEDTIRRDLNEMAEAGKILKVYGGAISKSFHYPFQQNDVYARDAKKEIARKALKLIESGMVILTGGGTTMIEMARMVPENLSCTLFTVSPLLALELTEHSNLDVHLIGGQLAKNSQICVGAQVINQLSDIKADLCFMGTNGISLQDGITDSDWEVVQIKKAMINSAEKTAVMSIAEKINSIHKMKVCNLNAINYVITDLEPKHPQLSPYAKAVTLL